MAEVTKQEQDKTKCRVEEIIRKEKVIFFLLLFLLFIFWFI